MTNLPAPAKTTFVITKEYRRFVEFCDACRRHQYIGLCYGPPGVGKTLSARQYAQWDLIDALDTYYGKTEPPPPAVLPCRTVFYTPSVAHSPRMLDRDLHTLRRKLSCLVAQADVIHPPTVDFNPFDAPDCTELILVDEADRLKMVGLEHLRDVYDRGHFGLILVGMPGIEKRLARYPQLYSRVGFVHQFRPLGVEELRFLLEHQWEQLGFAFTREDFTDVEAVATIIRITGGNFRLLQRLFTQIERILEINELQTVTKEVIEAARESLVIGSL